MYAKKRRQSLFAAAIFLPVATLLLIGGYATYHFGKKQQTETNLRLSSREVDAAANLMRAELTDAVRGMLYLSDNVDMDTIFYGSLSKEHEDALLHFAETFEVFDQIRYLDNCGMEVVRINYRYKEAQVVPREKLQNKSDRYYFIEAMKLHRGEIYISPLDLNVEGGQIETPHNPMIRMSTPVFGSLGEQLGVVIVNYSGKHMLDMLKSVPRQEGGQLMLLNDRGYWLEGGRNKEEWGFMFDDRKDITFAARYPNEWTAMTKEWKSQLHTDAGTFVSLPVCPAEIVNRATRPRAATATECWWLVSHLSNAVLDANARSLRDQLASVILPVLLLLAAGAFLMAHLRTRSMRAELMTLKQIESNARFVPREFLGLLHKEALSDVTIADHVERPMVVLFTDIRSYTAISEVMSPPQVLAFLNAYYQVLDPIISRHGGFIDAFIGDAIMALFPGETDAALNASIEIRAALENIKYTTTLGTNKGLNTGIGLHCGEVTLGTVGTDRRMQTTAIGDTVNIAARIESASKLFGINVIISSDIYDTLTNPGDFKLRSIDLVRVKGKQDVVELFEVFDNDPPEVIAGKLESQGPFDEGMLHYREGDFELAIEKLNRCLEICPEDTIPPIYIKRCSTMLRIPPGDAWQGVTTL